MSAAKVMLLSVFLSCIVFIDATSEQIEIESRGKKKKIALFVYFADIILKKIFIFKLVYAFIFWVVIHKAGYFLSWFISYLKEKKNEHHDHAHYAPVYEHGPSYEAHYGPPSYGPPSYGPPSYGPPSYGSSSYGPYKRESHGV